MSVGVLALQDSYNEHLAALNRIGVKGVEVKKPEQLGDVSSLIILGGEGTTMAKLAEYHILFPALREFVKMGKPVWGTCAGLIFSADKVVRQKTGGQELLGGLDCIVHRKFFGGQLQSCEAELSVPAISAEEGGPETFRAVFIQAPAILEVGTDVEVLADYSVSTVQPRSSKSDAESLENLFMIFDDVSLREKSEYPIKVIVAVKQGKLLATAFHPELTADSRCKSAGKHFEERMQIEAQLLHENGSRGVVAGCLLFLGGKF